MRRLTDTKHTVRASSLGYVIQSMVNTFAPLLFVTFQNTYEVSLAQISFLIAINFVAQIVLDFLASGFADKIGYRKCVVAAQILITVGIAGLAFLPDLFANPFAGLVTAVIIYGCGGGLTEVLLTPIVQACPIERKSQYLRGSQKSVCPPNTPASPFPCPHHTSFMWAWKMRSWNLRINLT